MVEESQAMKLRLLRARRGATLAEAAELTGVRRETISELERGVRTAQSRTLKKLAKGYGVDVADLVEVPPVPLGKAEASDRGPTKPELKALLGEETYGELMRHGRVSHWRDLIIHIGGLLQDLEGTYEVTPSKFEQMSSLAFTLMRTYEIEDPKAGATPEQVAYLEQAEGVLGSGLTMLEERAEKALSGITSLGEYKEKKARALSGAGGAFGALREAKPGASESGATA